MKIAIVRQRYNPYGGAERFVERALGALVQEGAEVTLITRSWDGAPAAGFAQITCDPPYSRLWGGRAARDASFARCAQQAMAEGGFDITQSHERIPGCRIFRAGDGVHAAWLEHRARARGGLTCWLDRLSGFHRYILAQERAMLTHPALARVICNSRLVAEEMQRYYGVPEEKLVLIENGVDLEHFHPRLAAAHRVELRGRLGIAAEAPLFLYVGGGFERKGVPRLLRAFAAMASQEVHLLVVGGDRSLKAMSRLADSLGIGERVVFTGPQKDVRPYYGAADAFVLPTLYDPGLRPAHHHQQQLRHRRPHPGRGERLRGRRPRPAPAHPPPGRPGRTGPGRRHAGCGPGLGGGPLPRCHGRAAGGPLPQPGLAERL